MKILLVVLFLNGLFAFAERPEIPNNPPEACYRGCTDTMNTLLEKFEKASVPKLEPAVYSGGCHHLSRSYNPDHEHFATTLIDLNDLNENRPYLSTQFSFFTEKDEAADWNLDRTRTEFGEEWKTSTRVMSVADGTARAVVWYEDFPSYIYWVRQNPEDGTLYMITYWDVGYMISFCELKRHPL